ncbi:MAG: methyltransferase domain-containing protein [Flavobacteriales bacterium]|nr:methyltransferase domain-containing protein [Flavobacteriales bacterium]MDG1779520.1 methyltransferase domain-containing protein [Flavobacteriales bacterium]MDG2246272.1 methyltransferase domain-containing protein [Flavobacteriales bacterium]
MNKIISFVTRFIPRHILQRVAHLFLQVLSLFYRGNKIEDPINGIKYRKILPYGRVHPRENALAPDSMSLERHRLIWLYLKEKTNFFTDDLRFLHMAPEYCFLRLFKKLKNIDYVTGDLLSPWAEHHFDAHQIPFEDNSFDVVMANHLLEHVEDDRQVMREFHRVMKPGGWGIFQVPIDFNNPHTEEDKNVTDPAERERLYWQRDHVRLFGMDYGQRLRDAGFEVVEDRYVADLGKEMQERYALMSDEILYFCRKA